MLEYQKQDCDMTLQEGLDCYYNSFPETTEILEDNEKSGSLLRDHDCTHVMVLISLGLILLLSKSLFWILGFFGAVNGN
jgi:hypothetical protein